MTSTSRAGRVKKNSTASPHHGGRGGSEGHDMVNDVLTKERIKAVSLSRDI